MKSKLLILALFALFLGGCASVQPLKPEVAEKIRQDKVAIVYHYPQKNINYDELVYKVFWNEMHSNAVSFDGLWDIDAALTQKYGEKFNELGLMTSSAKSELPEETFEGLRDNLMKFSAQDPEQQKTISWDESVADSLKQQGYSHLIFVRQYPLTVQVFGSLGMSSLVLQGSGEVKVFDTYTNNVEYNGPIFFGMRHEFAESPREIEKNDLEVFKKLMNDGVDALFAEDVLPKTMGLVTEVKP